GAGYADRRGPRRWGASSRLQQIGGGDSRPLGPVPQFVPQLVEQFFQLERLEQHAPCLLVGGQEMGRAPVPAFQERAPQGNSGVAPVRRRRRIGERAQNASYVLEWAVLSAKLRELTRRVDHV